MLKKIAFGGVGILLLATPFISSADTLSDLQAQVQVLIAQLQALQAQAGLSTSPIVDPVGPTDDYGTGVQPSSACPKLSITMQRGSRDLSSGGQVTELQIFLADYYNLNEEDIVTGYFGKVTEANVIKFQKEQGLPVFGIAGSLTRAKIAQVCGGAAISQTGTYIGFINGSALTTLQNVTQTYALEQCKAMAPAYPTMTVRCTWNATEIYKTSPQGVTLTASPSSGSAPLTVRFDTSASGSSSDFFIDFGDGTAVHTGFENGNTHIYASAGTYAAVLRKCTLHISEKDCDGSVLIGTAIIAVSSPNVSTGTLSVSTDASSPAYQTAAGGSTGVTLGVYKLRASGEAVRIDKLNTFLSNDSSSTGKPASIVQLYVYSGSALVGTGVFAGVGQNSTITLSSPVVVPKDVDARITIKADLARIGTGQPGIPGDLIRLQLASAQGTGVTSGESIGGNNDERFGQGNTSGVAGVRIFRSFPTVAQIPLPTDGLADGRLLRFKITANSTGPVSIGKLAIMWSSANTTAPNALDVYAYTDSAYSNPVIGGPHLGGTSQVSGALTIPLTAPLQIPAGATYYFEVRGNVSVLGSGATFTTTLLGDSANTVALESGTVLRQKDVNFVWSPNDITTSQFSDNDWTNGYGLPGLPAGGISQTRTGGGTNPTPTPSATHGNFDYYLTSSPLTSSTPTISGTATGASSVTITVSSLGKNYFSSSAIPVVNGHWSVQVSPALANDYYALSLWDYATNANIINTTIQIAAPSSSSDSSIKLLLHADGTDASTTLTDSSSGAKTVTANGNAQIDTTQSKFGGTSALFDGTGDYLSVPDSADWDFGSGDFTIDLWVKFNATGEHTLLGQYFQTGQRGWLFYVDDSAMRFYFCTGTTDGTQKSVSWTYSTGTWYHVTVTRSGNNLYFFKDGVQQGAAQDVTGLSTFNSTNELGIGALEGTGPVWGDFFTGWMDEVRISKGIARWTSNFTPPTSVYSASASAGAQSNTNANLANALTALQAVLLKIQKLLGGQ